MDLVLPLQLRNLVSMGTFEASSGATNTKSPQELQGTMDPKELSLSELSFLYPNTLLQHIWPSGCLMKNQEQFYISGVESGSYS